MNKIIFPIGYYPDPTKSLALAGGQLYIGEVDVDPETPANQITVYALQEAGTNVAISQPITLSAGGVPQYLGSSVSLFCESDYSMKVLDSSDAQIYYIPNSSLTADEEKRVFETVTALIDSSADGYDFVEILGFYAAGDGGGGNYIWDASANKTTHNGGTIIDPSTTVTPGEVGWWTTTSGSGTGVWVKQESVIDIRCFGAVGDGVAGNETENSEAINACLGVGGVIEFGPNETYVCDNDALATDQSIEIRGNGAEISEGYLAISGTDITVSVKNLTIDVTAKTGIISLGVINAARVRVDGCTFGNGRISITGSTAVERHNVSFTHNKVVSDFSSVDYIDSQYDVLNVSGYKTVDISNNTFDAHNIHRVMKITSSTATTAGVTDGSSPSNVFINANYITADKVDTSNGKQVIDLYSATNGCTVSNNIIIAEGFDIVVENKSAETLGAYGAGTRTLLIDNNTIFHNGAICEIRGSYGRVDQEVNNVGIISNNAFTITSQVTSFGSTNPVHLRALDEALLTGNSIHVTNPTTMDYTYPVCFRSCKINNMVGNIVDGGGVYVTNSLHPLLIPALVDLTKQFEQVTIVGNSFANFEEFGCVYINGNDTDYTVACETIIINSNSIMTDSSDATMYAIFMDDVITQKFIAIGNAAYMPNHTTGETIQLTSCTITDQKTALNSWVDKIVTSELTIADGVITATGGFHTVDTQGDAASDDLDTITTGVDGQILIISPENTARSVVVTNAGNIALTGGVSFTMADGYDNLTLMYRTKWTKWTEIARMKTA